MKRLIIAASVALIGIGAANAASSHHKKAHAGPKGPMIERNVGLGLDPAQRGGRLGVDPAAPRANSDLKYGAQPAYPQSPPGGGY
jgi:hypothetical protein